VVFDNYSFFTNVLKVYPFAQNSYYVISTAIVLISFLVLFFTLLSSRLTTKPILILTLMVSSFTSYFMNTYHVVIDDSMIRNSLQTDMAESLDLFTLKLVLYVVFLGLLPSYLVYKVKIEYKPFGKELFSKLKTIVLAILLIVLIVFAFSKFYTSFFRENKPLRYYTNPTYWIYSVGKYIDKTYNNGPIVVEEIGLDAKIDNQDKKRKIVIMVVGEAARWDRFSLNGYEKETNPLLKKENIINFSNTYSCGTSTAHSVPCMFSIYDRKDYNYKKGISTQNVVDVINRTNKVDILWRDNNSDSKGVAIRVDYEDFKRSNKYVTCKGECRDEGMLVGLDERIKDAQEKDVLIILHQMGNHGPAYFKRYPKEFEKFTPVCKTNQIEQCTQEEVSNAYDNALLYTDYFLTKVIDFLKPYSKDNDTAMIYMSDHGESLGEGGVYLHGLPYFMAPEAQKHIGSLMWFGNDELVNTDKLKSYSDSEFSQDNLFSTLLGIFDVRTEVYEPSMDILKKARE
jgi:lipid A ethanolaminephosphotransferase